MVSFYKFINSSNFSQFLFLILTPLQNSENKEIRKFLRKRRRTTTELQTDALLPQSMKETCRTSVISQTQTHCSKKLHQVTDGYKGHFICSVSSYVSCSHVPYLNCVYRQTRMCGPRLSPDIYGSVTALLNVMSSNNKYLL